MNDVKFSGNICNDIVPRTIPSGASVCNFTIANTKKYKDQSGTLRETTTFVDCVWWGSSAGLVKWNKKGSKILVSGELQQDFWEDQNGNKRNKLKIKVNEMEFFFNLVPDGTRNSNNNNNSGGGNNQFSTLPEEHSWQPERPMDEPPF